MPKFEGCAQAKEISLTRKGANPLAYVLARKSAAAQPAQTENIEMPTQAEITKAALKMTLAVAKMDDVTKTYFLDLGEDAQVSFIEKSGDEQKAAAHAAKAAAEQAEVEKTAREQGKTAREVELEKRLENQGAEIDALKAKDAEREIEKRADSEFAGFPGGAVAAVEMLKSFAGLPEAARLKAEAMMKSQCQLAYGLTKSFGARQEADVSKADAAKTRLAEAAKSYADEHKVAMTDAKEAISEMAKHAADIEELNRAGMAF